MLCGSGLIIKPYWLDKIFNKEKTWEIRGCNTNKRGRIFLIASGSGKVYGEVSLTDSFPMDKEDLRNHSDKHQIEDINIIKYKKPHVWVFDNPTLYEHPKPYNHPKGAVIWVTINIK